MTSAEETPGHSICWAAKHVLLCEAVWGGGTIYVICVDTLPSRGVSLELCQAGPAGA